MIALATAQADDVVSTDPAQLQQRVEELETTIRRIQARWASESLPEEGTPPPTVRPLEAATATGAVGSAANSVPLAGWNDGFFLRSADNQFMLRLTGQIQIDYRDYLDDRDRTDIDSFLLRRARLGIEATLFKYYDFRLLPDFGGGASGAKSPSIQDAYLNIHYWNALQVEVGKFKQPFSYEQLIQDRYVPTMERSMIDQLVPARDVGAMLHGENLLGGRFDYGVAASNGEINGSAETNNSKDFNGRVALRPFHDPDCPGGLLDRLGFGFSAGYGIQQNGDKDFTSNATNTQWLATPATVPWLEFNAATVANGMRSRFSPEITYFYESLGLAAQYYHQEQQFSPSVTSPIVENVPFDGFYVMGTYLLTGETRYDYTQQIEPLAPFDANHPFTCPGAWELVIRGDRLKVGSQAFAGTAATQLANPALWSSGASETTIGFNWYFNKWARCQFNWEHAWFDQPVALGVTPVKLLSAQDTLYARFQIIF
jgi:phosphate-selective porin OprO/OprP